jgi:antitoxin CcdA
MEGGMDASLKLDAAKKAVNLSLNSDLLRQGKELGLNLSSIAEAALAEAVRAGRAEAWLRENAEAILAYNRPALDDGIFSDGFRRF